MKEAKNKLLFLGVFLYIIDTIYNLYCLSLWNANSKYLLTQVLISCVSIFISSVLPIILLILNFKNKYVKWFIIIVATVSVLEFIYHLIPSEIIAVPTYLIFSKLGLIDSMWFYIFPSRGIFRLLGCISVTIGSILSIKSNKKES